MTSKTALFSILFFVFVSQLFSQIPQAYYNNAAGLSGDSLKDALNDIIDGHTEYYYTSSSQDDCWDILKKADKDPDSANNVIGVYSAFSMDGPKEYDGGKGWSREHVWAKSRGNFSTSRGIGTDLHNLRAEDVSTNSARNNRNFDNATIRYIDNSGNYSGTTDSYTSSSTDWVWEPRDEMKGDIARTIFYMTVRYEGENGELDLELTDSLLDKSDKRALHGNAVTLYQWHLDDTVSNAERARNDTIYKYQKNRNPFVDHPEYVDSIYGATYGPISVGLEENVSRNELMIYPNPSKGKVYIHTEEKIQLIQVFNLKGQLVQEIDPRVWNWQLPANPGMYIVKLLTHDKHLIVRKIIRE